MGLIEVLKTIPLLRLPARFRWSPYDADGRIPHGVVGIRRFGHRDYVGGLWDEIGRLQFDFLVSQGLQPHHYLLDIACGSLRAGVHFIPYLEPGHYLGIDKEAELIQAGLRKELAPEVRRDRHPVLLVNGEFAFDRFGVRPDYALAQSLFTHLTPPRIEKCLGNLRPVIAEGGVFYATFFESSEPQENPEKSHDWAAFRYTREEMERFGRSTGWDLDYIGDWNHPRSQRMVRYRPR